MHLFPGCILICHRQKRKVHSLKMGKLFFSFDLETGKGFRALLSSFLLPLFLYEEKDDSRGTAARKHMCFQSTFKLQKLSKKRERKKLFFLGPQTILLFFIILSFALQNPKSKSEINSSKDLIHSDDLKHSLS